MCIDPLMVAFLAPTLAISHLLVRGSHGFSLFVKSISIPIFSVILHIWKKYSVFISVNGCFILINTFLFFQTCKIAEKIEFDIDFTKREIPWKPRTINPGMGWSMAWNGNHKGAIFVSSKFWRRIKHRLLPIYTTRNQVNVMIKWMSLTDT